MKLQVKPASKKDVYRDIVRVPEQCRVDSVGTVVPEGSVCGVATPERTAYCIVRGTGQDAHPLIYVDERLRNMLGVETGDTVEFRFTAVGLLGQVCWAWSASEPAYRVAARLSVLSVVLGVVGALLGLLSLWKCP